MKQLVIGRIFLFSGVLLAMSCSRQPKSYRMPAGWHGSGEQQLYMIGVDDSETIEGKKAVTIRSEEQDMDSLSESGVFSQYCSAEPFRGKRIRLRGSLKTHEVKGWGGLWMRIDQTDSIRMQYFDNMYDRGVTGTADWKEYDIVLDVPPDAKAIAFGAMLTGSGQMWVGKLSIDTVTTDVATTGRYYGSYSQEAYNNSGRDTIDYMHTNKAELDREYKTQKYLNRSCSPENISYVQQLTNLSFEQ